MNTTLWLLIIGALLQLVGVIGYVFNRGVVPTPVWIPALIVVGWVLLVIGIAYAYSDYSKVENMNLPGADLLGRILPQ